MRTIKLFWILSTCICLIPTFSLGQPQFETPFYFEDAAGKRDTVIIGGDTSANYLVNTQFGEELLTGPWDNEFEVRVTSEYNYHNHLWFGDTLYLYNKKIIDLPFDPGCGYVASMIFLFYTNNHPVTVTWDTSIWSFHNVECVLDGSFFHHSDEILEPGWWTSFDWHYACLGNRTIYQFDTSHVDPYSGIIDSVDGMGREFIYGLQLATHEIEDPISPCQMKVGNEFLFEDSIRQFVIFPNPASYSFSIVPPEGDHYNFRMFTLRIKNMQGIEVKRLETSQGHHIIINDLSAGIYFVTIENQPNSLHYIQKLLIIN